MLWTLVSSLQTHRCTHSLQKHIGTCAYHTHRAKVRCSGNVASFTDFFFAKGDAPPGKDLDGGDGGREKGLHILATTHAPVIWQREGRGGRVKERGMSEHKSQRSQN